MKFVDEVKIHVKAGDGGRGCLSFRREKFIPLGGPDGGDGGNGGNVWFRVDSGLSTLLDFRYKVHYKADRGAHGMGKNRHGKGGEDLFISVPPGTLIYDDDSGELLADLTAKDQQMLLLKGGMGGRGNARFTTSTNRAPRHTQPGMPGDERNLRLQLKLLADVGLLGLPNAGKSTLIHAISAARPKVADYPFTTLVPNLGVVALEHYRSFVVADVPGVIEGAADGAGLGIRFLRHLTRTRLLLHLVDLAPVDGSDPAHAVHTLHGELEKFSPTLAQRDCWLVFNKADLLPPDEARARAAAIVDALGWSAPWHLISAAERTGTTELCEAVMNYLEARARIQAEDPEAARHEREMQEAMQREARERIAWLQAQRTGADDELADQDEDDDDHDVEVFHAP